MVGIAAPELVLAVDVPAAETPLAAGLPTFASSDILIESRKVTVESASEPADEPSAGENEGASFTE